MDEYNISDEQLASFMENEVMGFSNDDFRNALDLDDIEVLAVADKAMETFPSADVVHFPEWIDGLGGRVACRCSPMAADFCCSMMEEDDNEIPEEDED